jgi:hypothetical protein
MAEQPSYQHRVPKTVINVLTLEPGTRVRLVGDAIAEVVANPVEDALGGVRQLAASRWAHVYDPGEACPPAGGAEVLRSGALEVPGRKALRNSHENSLWVIFTRVGEVCFMDDSSALQLF